MSFPSPSRETEAEAAVDRGEEDEEEADEEAESALSPGSRTPAQEESAIHRRRRDVRATRDRLGEQYEQLRRVLPEPQGGMELTAKAQVLQHSLHVIRSLMGRAAELALELAVVTPEATRRWVRNCADDGRKPLVNAVSSVMKLFAARRGWRYAEWWTLAERRDDSEEEDGREDFAMGAGRLVGVMEEPGNVHGCVVRDSVSVMRLGWTLIQCGAGVCDGGGKEDEELASFARASRGFEFRPKVGMPGRVWTSKRAEWLIDLADRETFIRGRLAAEFGMKTCLGVPITIGGHVHSVMAFYAREVRGYNPECYDLACLLSQCLEEVYSPSNGGPWQVATESLFPERDG
eukprot:GFKZ01009566.1.p1 GENE.GFKZ01009566.1~~GFKZ01009566.1.p1  ORF type:complete len:347 (-),score=36.06 GFKZ01009566.1:237-1277(-)